METSNMTRPSKHVENKLKKFFEQPGINLSGISEQAGYSRQYVHSVLNGEKLFTWKFVNKMVPVMKKYGFKE